MVMVDEEAIRREPALPFPVEFERSIEAFKLLPEAEPVTEMLEPSNVTSPLAPEPAVEAVLMPPITDKLPPAIRMTLGVLAGPLLLMEEFIEKVPADIRARGDEAELVIDEAEMAPLTTRGAMNPKDGVERKMVEALSNEATMGPAGKLTAGAPSMEMVG